MIIARYITKEVLLNFLAITALLLFIALSNRFAAYLAKAATGELPVTLVFKVVGLYIPELLTYLIPLSFFIAILFAYGRLHAESEMTVLMSCGVSWGYISRLTLMLAAGVMVLTACLSLWWVPKMAVMREQALSEGEAFGMMQAVVPGRFQTMAEGKLVFYLEDVASKQNLLKGVFIAERPTNINDNLKNGWTLITADQAKIERDATTKDFYLVLKQGYRYQGVPGSANYTIVKFDEYGRAMQPAPETQNEVLRMKDSASLFITKNPEETAELQWRLSLPLTVPILALLAIPLARVRPRHGRFAKFLPAIFLYIVYYNLFTVCKRWVAQGMVPGILGVWWIHLLFLGLGLYLLGRESGWFVMRKMRKVS